MQDNQKEAEKMTKEIFICDDNWLKVFALLSPSQLGLRIALVNHRFDQIVDEHFKTRPWTLGLIRIESKMGRNGTRQMLTVNSHEQIGPNPSNHLPTKVTKFKRIWITYLDNNVIAFLHPFASFDGINLAIWTKSDRISELIMRNIWPMFKDQIYGMEFQAVQNLQLLRRFVPSLLTDCPSLRFVSCAAGDILPQFPANQNGANASNGQAVANWLLSPRHAADGAPKVLQCCVSEWHWSWNINALKTAFLSAFSPATFIIVISWANHSVLPFNLTNKLTREQLALKITSNSHIFLLIRCPISRDEHKWAKWEEEAIEWRFSYQWNKIFICVDECEIGAGLLDNESPPNKQPRIEMNE